MKEVIRSYCVYVLLGLPGEGAFRLLAGYARHARTVLFAERLPHWLPLTGVAARPMPSSNIALLWELSALAEKYEGKVLTLIPVTADAAGFVAGNRDRLEEQYRIAALPAGLADKTRNTERNRI